MASSAAKPVLRVASETSGTIMQMAQQAQKAPSQVGVVVSAGRMDRAVKVRMTKQRQDTFLRRLYKERPEYIVSDPANATRLGDVVRFSPWKTRTLSHRIAHVVTEIIKPFGPALSERPPVASLQELLDRRQVLWDAKQVRRAARRAEEEARERGEAGLVDVQTEAGEAAGDKMAARVREMDEAALESERQAEELEKQAAREGVDLNTRIDQMQKS